MRYIAITRDYTAAYATAAIYADGAFRFTRKQLKFVLLLARRAFFAISLSIAQIFQDSESRGTIWLYARKKKYNSLGTRGFSEREISLYFNSLQGLDSNVNSCRLRPAHENTTREICS